MEIATTFFVKPSDFDEFMQIETTLPFEPYPGLMVDLDGTTRKVTEVILIKPAPFDRTVDGVELHLIPAYKLEVYFEDDSDWTADDLHKKGWRFES